MELKSKNYSAIDLKKEPTVKTGNPVLDGFISTDGGFVVGASIFLTGTSGAGKTTLAYTLQKTFEDFTTSLYSREMSASAVKQQMSRYEMGHTNSFIADKDMCSNFETYLKELDVLKPKVVIIDSLQVIAKEDYADMSEEAAAYLIIKLLREWTEKNGAVSIMVGHVNKDGGFEGRNTLQHMFDAHLEMIYDKKKNTRTLSWDKNRKGATGDKLYYEFGEETILFYTAEEWRTKKDGKELSNFIEETVKSFIIMYKGHENYKAFKKEIKAEFLKKISSMSSVTNMEKVIELAKVTQIAIENHII